VEELQGGCNGSEHNLIGHLVISLSAYTPSLPLLLFSVTCPEIPLTPSQTLLLLWNRHTVERKVNVATSTLQTKLPCPAL